MAAALVILLGAASAAPLLDSNEAVLVATAPDEVAIDHAVDDVMSPSSPSSPSSASPSSASPSSASASASPSSDWLSGEAGDEVRAAAHLVENSEPELVVAREDFVNATNLDGVFAASQPLRILAYGDSLTLGCTNGYTCPVHPSSRCPYSRSLQAYFDRVRGPGQVVVDHRGRLGAQVDQMTADLDATLTATPYDVVLIEGGGNDIFHWFMHSPYSVPLIGMPPPSQWDRQAGERGAGALNGIGWTGAVNTPRQESDRVVRYVKALHAVAHKHGARTVALGIPVTLWAMRNKGFPAFQSALTARIRRESGADAYIHVAKLLPFEQLLGNDMVSTDEIHFKCPALLRFGERLAPKLDQALTQWTPGGAAATNPPLVASDPLASAVGAALGLP